MKNFFRKIKNSKFGQAIGGFFYRNFKVRFQGLNSLVVMQLKDKLSFSFKADKKGALIKILLYAIGFIVITAVIAVIMMLMGMLNVFPYGLFPVDVFNLIFFAMFILSILSCISKLTKSLFFSKDNLVLLSYPVRPNTVFFSKLIVFYILELIKTFSYLVPLFLAYGIVNGFPVFYYPWAILMFFVISFIPVAVASLLSIPYMYIQMFLRKRPFVQDVLAVILLIVLTVGVFWVISLIPADIHFISQWPEKFRPAFLQFTSNLQVWLAPLFFVSSLIIGCQYGETSPKALTIFTSQTGIILLCVIGSIILLFLLAYLLAKPLFFRIAVKPFEYNKKIIFHNFKTGKEKENIYEEALTPVFTEKLSRKQINDFKNVCIHALNEMVKNEKLFASKKINMNKLAKLLKKYTKVEFEVVPLATLYDKCKTGFFIQFRHDIPSLVLAKKIYPALIESYDPTYLPAQNRNKTAFFSCLWKDLIVDIRTPGILMSNYLMFIITPIAIALLNKVFDAINTDYLGNTLTTTFTMLILVLIPLATNVGMASIYSREGESAYLLKAAPNNYMKMLTAKLVLRFMIMTLSIAAATLCYRLYSSLDTLKPILIFSIAEFIYVGHLLWSAELDFMNPQDKLYAEMGEGNVSNPNETTSAILCFVIAIFAALLTYFFYNESSMHVFYKLFLVAALFLGARILLFAFKIKGYRTSRGERGRD